MESNGRTPAEQPRRERQGEAPEGAGELVGATFSSPAELRHIAERELGVLFVPAEMLSEHHGGATFVLRPRAVGPIVVHAERAQPWHPFRITHVEGARAGRGPTERRPRPARALAAADQPRLPRGFGGVARPRIDWL
jgi:hypothetical protein